MRAMDQLSGVEIKRCLRTLGDPFLHHPGCQQRLAGRWAGRDGGARAEAVAGTDSNLPFASPGYVCEHHHSPLCILGYLTPGRESVPADGPPDQGRKRGGDLVPIRAYMSLLRGA